MSLKKADLSQFDAAPAGPYWLDYGHIVNSEDESVPSIATVGDWEVETGSRQDAINKLLCAAPILRDEVRLLRKLVEAQSRMIDILEKRDHSYKAVQKNIATQKEVKALKEEYENVS